jgi:hypothetical protein
MCYARLRVTPEGLGIVLTQGRENRIKNNFLHLQITWLLTLLEYPDILLKICILLFLSNSMKLLLSFPALLTN